MKSNNQDIILEKQKKIEEQKNIIEAQKARIIQLENQVKYYKDSFYAISNAFFWKISSPIRFLLDLIKERHNLFGFVNLKKLSIKELFTQAELLEQHDRQFTKKVKFSVIVPLYNTSEKYLKEMIESVIAQTYGDRWQR